MNEVLVALTAAQAAIINDNLPFGWAPEREGNIVSCWVNDRGALFYQTGMDDEGSPATVCIGKQS